MAPDTTAFPIDFRTLRRSAKPNQCLALPEGYAAASPPDLVAPVFPTGPRQLRGDFEAAIGDEPRLERTRTSADGLQIELVQRSRWFGFRDRITVGFVALDADRSSLVLWSRSESGTYDFGVNRKRVRRWLDRLGARSGTPRA